MSRKLRVAVTAADAARRGVLLRVIEAAGHAVGTPEAADVILAERDAADEPARTLLLTDAPENAPTGEAAGVLPRTATAAQIDAAIRAVAAGLTVRPGAGAPALNGFHPREERAEEDRALPLLTPREIEILSAVGEGMSNKEVARRLGISGHTVKFHLEAVFAKLDAATRAEAVAKGLRRGLIEI